MDWASFKLRGFVCCDGRFVLFGPMPSGHWLLLDNVHKDQYGMVHYTSYASREDAMDAADARVCMDFPGRTARAQ